MQTIGHVSSLQTSLSASSGSVASYIHAGGRIGVLVEVHCESDFVARSDEFKMLVHDIAMHIAATDPKFVRKENVTTETFKLEKDVYRSQLLRRERRLKSSKGSSKGR